MNATRPSITSKFSARTIRRGRAVLVGIAATAILGATAAPALAGGPVHAAPLNCEGQTIDTAAPIHYRTETFIKAPVEAIWNLHTDVEHWPAWQRPVTSMQRLDSGPLHPGSAFRWTTPAPATASTPATTLSITSTVQQVQPQRCIRWTGPAVGNGMSIEGGTHVWNFIPVPGGTLVRTEENWKGAQVEADVPTSTRFLGMGLDAWLADMKKTAEH